MLGGLYTLFATGLALVFGVMRIVNVAHGDFIVLAAYVALTTVALVPIHPLTSLVIVVPAMAAVGYALQRVILNRITGPDPMPPLLVTFGISIVLENVLLQIFGGNTHKLQAGALETQSVSVAGASIGVYPLLVFVVAISVIVALQHLLYRTSLGRLFRATSDDSETARLMGVRHKHIYAVASAIAFAVVAIAGVLLAIRTNFDPTVGPARLLTAFEVVIIGGLGSFWGTLAGGVVLGFAQAIGSRIDPSVQTLAGHLIFLVVLLARPTGLFPKIAH